MSDKAGERKKDGYCSFVRAQQIERKKTGSIVLVIANYNWFNRPRIARMKKKMYHKNLYQELPIPKRRKMFLMRGITMIDERKDRANKRKV